MGLQMECAPAAFKPPAVRGGQKTPRLKDLGQGSGAEAGYIAWDSDSVTADKEYCDDYEFIPQEAFCSDIGGLVLVPDEPARADSQLPLLWAEEAGLEDSPYRTPLNDYRIGSIDVNFTTDESRVVDGKVEPSACRTVDSAARREIRGFCNSQASDTPVSVGWDTWCCLPGCVGMDTAVNKLKINLDSINVERGSISIGGVTGHTATCVGRVNGVALFFDKQRLIVDLYVLKDWNMGVDMLLGTHTMYKYKVIMDCERGIARIPDPGIVCNSDPVMHVVGESEARLPIPVATLDQIRADYPPPDRPPTRNPDCKTPERPGPCFSKCCSQFNQCVHDLHDGGMARVEADTLLGYEAAASAAACHGSPHTTWLWEPTLVLILVREEAYGFELGYEEHTVTWGTRVEDLLPLAMKASKKYGNMLRPFTWGLLGRETSMRVDMCSAPDKGSLINTFEVETVADLGSTVVYAVFSETGFVDPLGFGSHTVRSPGGQCWKDFPPSDIAREIYSAVLQRVRSGAAHMSALGTELIWHFRSVPWSDQASVLWVMRRCAHMPFPDDCIAAMMVRDSISAASLPEATGVDITSEMEVLLSSLSPERTSELKMGGNSGSPPTSARRNIAAPAVQVLSLPSALKATANHDGEDGFVASHLDHSFEAVVYRARRAGGPEDLHPLSIADQSNRLGVPIYGGLVDNNMVTMSDDDTELIEFKAWNYSSLSVIERLLQEYAHYLAAERIRGREPSSGLPNPYSRFQQWYKVVCQPSYMASHYADKPWSATFLAELDRSKKLARATTDANGEARHMQFQDELKEAFRCSAEGQIETVLPPSGLRRTASPGVHFGETKSDRCRCGSGAMQCICREMLAPQKDPQTRYPAGSCMASNRDQASGESPAVSTTEADSVDTSEMTSDVADLLASRFPGLDNDRSRKYICAMERLFNARASKVQKNVEAELGATVKRAEPEGGFQNWDRVIDLPVELFDDTSELAESWEAVHDYRKACDSTSAGKPVAKVDLTDDETGYNVGYVVFWSEGGRTVHAHPDAVETVLAVRNMVKKEHLEVGSLAKKKKVWRTDSDPFGPDADGRPPTKVTGPIREALNAESEKVHTTIHPILARLMLDPTGTDRINVYTLNDLKKENMIHVDWYPDYQRDIKKHGLRPQSPAQLKVIVKQLLKFAQLGWIERWNGAPPEVIHPIFCIPKPTPKEDLADPNKGQRWRVLVDGQMGNKLMVPASGPVSTVENVLNHLQDAARESLRQIKANKAGTRRLADSDKAIGPWENWRDHEGNPHPDRPELPIKQEGQELKIVDDEYQPGKEYELPTQAHLGCADIIKAFHRLKVAEGKSRSRLAFSCAGLHSIWAFCTGAMGHANTPSEWERAIRRQLRVYGILADEEATAGEVTLDPTPVDLGPGTGETFVCPSGAADGDRVELRTKSGRLMMFTIPAGTSPGDTFEAPVNSLAEIDGYPAPQKYLCLYVDDLVTVSATEDECIRCWKHLAICLWTACIWITVEKVLLGCAAIQLLGAYVSHRHILADPERVEDILTQAPCTLKRRWTRRAVRRFLGQVNFCRSHLASAARAFRPLTALTKLVDDVSGSKIPEGDVSAFWTERCQEDDPKYETHWVTLHGRYVGRLFTTSASGAKVAELCCAEGHQLILKELADYTLLYFPDPHAKWVCATDASQHATGAVGMFYEKDTGRLVPCFVHSQPGTKAFARKPASVREMIGVRHLFQKKGRVLRMMNPTIVVVTDHAANAGVQDRQICNNSEIETMRVELEQHRPWSLAYSQGDSPILDLADAASRLLDMKDGLLEDNTDFTLVDSLESFPCWGWIFTKLDEESALENIVYAAEASDEVSEPEDEEPYIPLMCGGAIASRPAPSTLSSLQAQSARLEDVAQYDALQEDSLEGPVEEEGFRSVPRPVAVALVLTNSATGEIILKKQQSRSRSDRGHWELIKALLLGKSHWKMARMLLKGLGLVPNGPKVRVERASLAPTPGEGGEEDRLVYMGMAASPSRQYCYAVYHADLADVGLTRWEWSGLSHFERHGLNNLPESVSTHDRQIIGRVLQSSVMLSDLGYKGKCAEVGSKPTATWHLELLPVAPVKLTGKLDLARGSLCDDDGAVYIAGENDSLEKIAAWLKDASNYKPPKGHSPPSANKLFEWNRGREDLRGLKTRSKLKADTRLRVNGPSKADDASPKCGGRQEQEEIHSEMNRRGYFTLDPCGLERFEEHQPGVELKPSHYAGTAYEGELALAKAVQNERGFLTIDSLLYHACPLSARLRLVIPTVVLQVRVIAAVHIGQYDQHLGEPRTYAELRKDFYWKGMTKQVSVVVAHCDQCQRNKHLRRSSEARPSLWVGEPIGPGHWHVDMIVGLPKTNSVFEYDAVLAMVCRWSGFLVAAPCHTTLDSIGYATMVWKELVCRMGETPRTIISDRAAIFTSAYTQAWMNLMGIRQVMTTAHRSTRVNGKVEITIQQLEAQLRNADLSQVTWITRLVPGVAAINTTPTSATERSPIERRTGRVPLTNLRLTEELRKAYDPAVVDSVEDQVRLMDECAELACEARAKVAERKTKQANGKHWLDTLVVGDMVMVNSETISTPAKKAGLVNRKTEPRWYGPYKVVAYVAYRTVQLQLPAKSKVWPHFHVSRLKSYKPPLDELGQPTVIEFPDISKELDFEVKKIVAHRYRAGKIQYLVNWVPPYHAVEHMSWESVKDCSNAQDAIKKYEKRQKALADFDPSQKLDFDNLMAPVQITGDQINCIECSESFTVAPGAVTSFCGGCIGGAAHQRWKHVTGLKRGQVKRVRDLLMGMVCATNYHVNSAW